MEYSQKNSDKIVKKAEKSKTKAVAVQYDPGMAAPSVVAKGVGIIAEKIVEKALESDVKVYQNAELVEELSKIDLGANIPPELYEVVAQVLIFVSDLDKMQGYRRTYDGKQK